jgi:hypothetical protein
VFEQVRRGSNIQLLSFSLVSKPKSEKRIRNELSYGQPITKNVDVDSYDLIEADHLLPGNDFFEPSTERRTTRIFELSTSSPYDVISVRASALVIKGDKYRASLTNSGFCWSGNEDDNCRRTKLPDLIFPSDSQFWWGHYLLSGGSALERLTSRPQVVYSWWIVGYDGQIQYPFPEALVAPKGVQWENWWSDSVRQATLALGTNSGSTLLRRGRATADFPVWQLHVPPKTHTKVIRSNS